MEQTRNTTNTINTMNTINTINTIEMDFRNAIRQADELEQVAKSLELLAANSFSACLSGIAANWKGENATAFCRKGTIVGTNIKRSAEELKCAAQALRQMAQNTYQAEKRNYEIAKNREYQ